MMYVPKGMPDYRHPSYVDRAAEEIRLVLRASQAGRSSERRRATGERKRCTRS